MEKLYIGKIVGTHGIKGEVKIKSNSSFSEQRFAPGNTVTLMKQGEEYQMECLTHRLHKGMDLVLFKGYEDINLVERFRDYEVYGQYDRALLDEDEYFYSDIIGCHVYDQDEQFIGKVISIMENPRYEILVIEKDDKSTMLVPYIHAFIIEDRIYDQYIKINKIEGL